MKIKKHVWNIVSLLTIGMIGLFISGCYHDLRSDQLTYTNTLKQPTMNDSGSINHAPCPTPKTGQRRRLMPGDDGYLRAGEFWPVPRFVENGNGTVTDQLTGLVWTRNANQANGTSDWEQAVSGAGACKEGGYTDWRLPNRFEMESLLDLDRFNPALPEGNPFKEVQPSYYWTSTTTANSDDDAWVIHFYIGFVAKDDKAGTHHVWYVRGVQ